MAAFLAAAWAAEGDQAETIEIDSIKNAELPKVVEITEAMKVPLVGESGRTGIVGLPQGTKVEVTGREGNMLQIVFVKSAGQVDIAKTTALDEVRSIRAANTEAERKRAMKAMIDERWQKKLKEMEEEKKRDILVHSWTWRQTRGGNHYEAVGEIENESGRTLENVQVEITIRDANGNIVSTDTALANDKNLAPGQRTTFSAMIRRVGGEQTASLAFRKFWGDRYTHREK